MDSENTISKYIKQVRENRDHKRYEQAVSPAKAYLAFDSDVKAHNEEFQKMCPEGLKAWIDNRSRQIGHSPSMLVLMGQVGVIRELDVPGIAVALADDRDKTTKAEDLENRRDLVDGDILLYKDTFNKVRKSMTQLGIESIDLAIMRGYQGNNWLTDDLIIQGKVLNEIIDILNPEGGALMVHGGTRIPHKELSDALNQLSSCPQLKVEHFENQYGLTTDIKITKLGQVNLQEFWRNNILEQAK